VRSYIAFSISFGCSSFTTSALSSSSSSSPDDTDGVLTFALDLLLLDYDDDVRDVCNDEGWVL
jgi:hypothetical protein